MTDELRAAAARLLQGDVVRVDAVEGCDAVVTRAMPNPDIRIVCEAVLREHPADDAEAVTEAWLREIGFRFDEHYRHWNKAIDDEADLHLRFCRGVWRWCLHYSHDQAAGMSFGSRATRGDVRRLLAALKITKEST